MIDSNPPLKVLLVYGTRPELIKLAPVIGALESRSESFEVTVCSTGQHREMLEQMESLFGVRPDHSLDLMQADQALNELASEALVALDSLLNRARPDWILVQGDTTTAMAASLAAFHRGVGIAHVEAGLRTGDLHAPYPEEANRRIVDLVSELLFAPTELARERLIDEGHAPERIHLTGNTVVDALQRFVESQPDEPERREVLVTMHRRESFGETLEGVLTAIARLAERFPKLDFVYPVHPNPNVRLPVHRALGSLKNVTLLDPLPYDRFLRHLRRAYLVLTDSGGVQEEAPTFAKPVLVLRQKTERPEGVQAGVARLVGTEPNRIVAEVTEILTDESVYADMARGVNPYGDGRAAERIAAILAGDPLPEFRAVEG